jgi:hypothetical protein
LVGAEEATTGEKVIDSITDTTVLILYSILHS